MKKNELARKLARKTGVTPAEAADQEDRMLNDILQKLRSGEPANMPGIGQFCRDADGRIHFQNEPGKEQGSE